MRVQFGSAGWRGTPLLLWGGGENSSGGSGKVHDVVVLWMEMMICFERIHFKHFQEWIQVSLRVPAKVSC